MGEGVAELISRWNLYRDVWIDKGEERLMELEQIAADAIAMIRALNTSPGHVNESGGL